MERVLLDALCSLHFSSSLLWKKALPAGAPELLHMSVLLYSVYKVTKFGLKKRISKQLKDMFCFLCKRDVENTSFSKIAIVEIWVKRVGTIYMHTVTPRGLDSSSLLLIKPLLTAVIVELTPL